jgi:RNA polymerase sigma factor (TIGR02999 family)
MHAAMATEHPRTSDFFALVYDELRQLAAGELARLPLGQSLQPTALVNEAYLKLASSYDGTWNGRGHFFGAAAQAMRQIIVDHVRKKYAKKRGAGHASEAIDEGLELPVETMPVEDVLAIDSALRDLEREHPRKAAVVVMRYFGGMSMDQIAEALEVTTRTIEREWRLARVLLAEALATSGAR